VTDLNGSWTNGPTSYSTSGCSATGWGAPACRSRAATRLRAGGSRVGHTIESRRPRAAGGSSTWATSAARVVLPLRGEHRRADDRTGPLSRATLTELTGPGERPHKLQLPVGCSATAWGALPARSPAPRARLYVPVEADDRTR